MGCSPWGHKELDRAEVTLSHSILVSVLKHFGVVLSLSETLMKMSYSIHYSVSATLLMLSEVKSLSHVQLFVTPWTVAYQAPPSMGFSRQEYWNETSFPSPGDFPDQGIKPGCPALKADALSSEPPGKLAFIFIFEGFPPNVRFSYFI